MSTSLHQLISSGPQAVDDCLSVLNAGDELLLIDAGVLLLAVDDQISRLNNAAARVYALSPDIVARGLQKQAQAAGASTISDAEWVQKVCDHQQILSWK